MTIDHAEAERIARNFVLKDSYGPEIFRLARAYLDARAKMRTPGTVEVCAERNNHAAPCYRDPENGPCDDPKCPLKPQDAP